MAPRGQATSRERMMAARIRLIRDHVFFGSMAMRLQLVEVENLPHLAGTDGRHLFYNPEMVEKERPQALTGLIAHEAMHPMLMHHLRRGSRHHVRWNIACDHAINLLIKEQGLTLPDGICCDEKYKDMTAEEVYDRLPEDMGKTGNVRFVIKVDEEGNVEPGQSMPDSVPGAFDVVIDAPGNMTAAEIKNEESAMKAAINNAAAMARKAGKMTNGLEKFIEALCAPKASWQAELWEFLTMKAATDHNWAEPDRRMLQQHGIFYPTLDGYKLGNLAVINDTSGSTSEYQEQFASELSDILEQFECEITVFNHDTTTKSIDTYSNDDMPLVLKAVGFGGSCAKHTFDLVREEYDFDLIVWLTDLELPLHRITQPDCPVLIACCERSMLDKGPDWATRVIDIT